MLISTGKGVADGIAFSPDGQRTYLAEYDPYYGIPQVMVVETGNSILLPGNSAVEAIAITSDGKHVYVPTGSNDVAVIETAGNTIIKTIAVGSSPTGIAVTPDGADVYVANQGCNSVSVVNTASNTVGDSVPVADPATYRLFRRRKVFLSSPSMPGSTSTLIASQLRTALISDPRSS